MDTSTAFTLVDSKDSLVALLKAIQECSTQPPSLFIDLEGRDLSRHGSVAILQLLIPPADVYIVDVHVLQHEAFQTEGLMGWTLKTVLESEQIPKVFFDVRNDSDALYEHYHIKLAGVQDLQVMEFATRRVPGKFLQGLSRCIQFDAGMSSTDKADWVKAKEVGKKLFAPERGGSYDVFFERPLAKEVAEYCVQDVTMLPDLLREYTRKLTPTMAPRVKEEVLKRVRLSQAAGYGGKGPHMAIGPWAPTEKVKTTKTRHDPAFY